MQIAYVWWEISKTVFKIFLAQILRKLCAKLAKCELDALFSHVSSDGRTDGRTVGRTVGRSDGGRKTES